MPSDTIMDGIARPPRRAIVSPRAAFGIVVAGLMVTALVTAVEPGWGTLVTWVGIPTVTVILSVIVALMMTAVPVCLSLVQGVARGRMIEKLDVLARSAVAQTSFYKMARMRIEAVRPVTMGYDYLLPMVTFSVVLLICAMGAWCAFLEPFFFDKASPVLGGITTLDKTTDVETYQRGTFVAGATAFLGAYTYVVYRLLERLNLDDISPITFYRYAAHIVVATIVAGIVRHGGAATGMEDGHWLVVVSFVVGLSPDLFITALTREVLRRWKLAGMRDDPASDTLPTASPLLMIDELKQPQADRLAELGISSAQDLAPRNPILLLTRLPFEPGQIVDWIAQAQLYALVRETGMKAMRGLLVRDIFGLHQRLSDQSTRAPTCAALGLPTDAADALLLQLESDIAFTGLREVRDAMIPVQPAAAASLSQGQRANVTGLSAA